MKTALYICLLIILPLNLLAKQDTVKPAIDTAAATQAAQPPQVVVKMPEESVWTLPTIITIILAAISLFTLLEMKAQRKSAYKPEINFQSRAIKTVLDNDEFRIHDYKLNEIDLKELKTRIINLGLGSAIDLHIQITADQEKFIHLYNIIKEKIPNNILTLKERNEGFDFIHKGTRHKWNFKVPRLVDFVLPETISNNRIEELELPLYYLYLISLCRKYPLLLPTEFDYPIIEIEMKYRDALSHPYTKKYRVVFIYEYSNETVGRTHDIAFTSYFYMKVEER